MDLSLYTPEELRIFGIRCDTEIAAALARGDTNSATGWGRVRSEIALRLAAVPTPAPPRRREEKTLPDEWYRTHVKVWDPDRKHWHYELIAEKKVEKKAEPPREVVLPSPTPTPTPGSAQLDELIRQYRRAKGESP